MLNTLFEAIAVDVAFDFEVAVAVDFDVAIAIPLERAESDS